MRDKVHRIVTRHILFLQEIGSVAFALSKDGDQNIGASYFTTARGLYMDCRALDHPLERGCWHSFRTFDICDQRRKVVFDEIF